MPLVEISLLAGKPPAYVRAIADGVHRALHEAFNAPADDRFQLIRQYQPGELIYDPDYLGIHRTDDVVFIHIVAGKWRDTATKQGFYKRVVELLARRRESARRTCRSSCRRTTATTGPSATDSPPTSRIEAGARRALAAEDLQPALPPMETSSRCRPARPRCARSPAGRSCRR